MARAPKLKVYATSIGFDDALVAAPSQKAALRAWGTSTDLFAAGRASIVEDPELQALALARPGEIVRRPHGDAKQLIAEMEAAERAEEAKPAARAKPRRAASPPDRSALDKAERALASAEREFRNRMDAFAAERAELEERERAARQEGETEIRELRSARDGAEAAYRRAADEAQR